MQLRKLSRYPAVRGWRAALFYSAWCFIGLVSAYDAYLVQVYRSFIQEMEENPICAALIRLDPQGLTFFMAGKLLGTAIVLTSLWMLVRWKPRLSMPVISGVAAFQFGGYVEGATPQAVPEPASCALLLIGGLCLLRQRRQS